MGLRTTLALQDSFRKSEVERYCSNNFRCFRKSTKVKVRWIFCFYCEIYTLH